MDENWGVTGEHVVRVEVSNCQVVDALRARVDTSADAQSAYMYACDPSTSTE